MYTLTKCKCTYRDSQNYMQLYISLILFNHGLLTTSKVVIILVTEFAESLNIVHCVRSKDVKDNRYDRVLLYIKRNEEYI